ncbi:MAG TPA: hypothetical protein DCS55_13840, partial [Acidimicrobiaceae bacterium]|nr:hypothetical protein [Acidimicrobiaceae bacterium]
MELLRDVDLSEELPGGLDQLEMGEIDSDELKRLFDFLEFHTLFDRLTEALGRDLGAMRQTEVLEAEVVDGTDPADAVAALARIAPGADGVDPDHTLGVAGAYGPHGGLEGLAIELDETTGDVLWLPADVLADESVKVALRPVLDGRG